MKAENVQGIKILTPDMIQIDALNAEEFKRQLSSETENSPRLILDLSPIQFIDSSGLGVLLGIVREMHEKGGMIALCCARPPVQVLFRMVRMSNIVTIHTDRNDALASFTT